MGGRRCAGLLIAACVATGCGRIAFDPLQGGSGGGDGGRGSGDGASGDALGPVQEAYLKASNTDQFDEFGLAVAISADASTVAVGSYDEASAAIGIDGSQVDNTAPVSGAAYVYARSGASWAQQAYVKATNTDSGDHFGASIALSADGSTLVVGAIGEASKSTVIDLGQADNTAAGAGAAYVYVRTGGSWAAQAYIKASNTDSGDQFGLSVALSGDGNTLAVGANLEASAATGIDGTQTDNSTAQAGAVYVFTRSGTTWTQQAYVKASNTGNGDQFGTAVALSADGNTLAVGAQGEASASPGVNGNQADNSAVSAGAVYVFARAGTTWTQQTYAKSPTPTAGDFFGGAVGLSPDGNTLGVGIPGDDSVQPNSGAAAVFTRSGTTWSPQAFLKAMDADNNDQFGWSLALAADTLLVGSIFEDGGSSGLNGDQADNSIGESGAAYVFTRVGVNWAQTTYLKATNPGVGYNLGQSSSLAETALVVGAVLEGSSTTGVDSTPDTSGTNSGAAYVLYH